MSPGIILTKDLIVFSHRKDRLPKLRRKFLSLWKSAIIPDTENGSDVTPRNALERRNRQIYGRL